MKNDMQDIVRANTHINEYDKDLLTGLFNNLYNEQISLFENIKNNINTQMQKNNERDAVWNIVTALIDCTDIEDAKKNGLSEICNIISFDENIVFEKMTKEENNSNNSKYSVGISFLRCAYHDVLNYTKKRYTAQVQTKDDGYNISYYLEPFNVFYKKEELLERTARQYDIQKPIIFSPMSRRAVNVKLDFGTRQITKSDNIVINLDLNMNGLEGVLLQNKTLVWNVEILEQNEMPRPKENVNKKIVPLFEKVYQLYEFCTEKNEFVYVETQISDMKKFGNSVYVNLERNQSIEDLRYFKLKITDCAKEYLINLENKYLNFYCIKKINKERIRTEADIEYVVSQFNNEIIEYEGLSRNLNNRHPVRVYEHRDTYHYTKNKLFRSSSICYLKFQKSDSWIFEDCVSYITSYLNYFYPEFYWVGIE